MQYKYYVFNAMNYLFWSVNDRKSPNLGIKNHWCQMLGFREKNLPDDPKYFVLYSIHTLFIVGLQFCIMIYLYPVDHPTMNNIPIIIINTLIFLGLMHTIQYFEHRIMHDLFYRYHKYHHYFKNPEPWDGFYVHPIEMYINMTIFFGPCLVMHPYIGLIEILSAHLIFLLESGISHTGIRTGIRYLDKMSVHHELHHSEPHCNYGTLTKFYDTLFNTLYKPPNGSKDEKN